MKGQIYYKPAGGSDQLVATPFTKYYNSEDYISCLRAQECNIYIKNEWRLRVNCAKSSAVSLTVCWNNL